LANAIDLKAVLFSDPLDDAVLPNQPIYLADITRVERLIGPREHVRERTRPKPERAFRLGLPYLSAIYSIAGRQCRTRKRDREQSRYIHTAEHNEFPPA
jgi:hypothetical protein